MTQSVTTAHEPGVAWHLGAGDQITFEASVRLEDTDTWSPAADQALTGGGYRGWATNAGNPALPWPSGNVVQLVLDARRRRGLFVVGSVPPHEPSLGDGQAFRAVAGMRQLPFRGHSMCGMSLSPDGRSAATVEYWSGAASGGVAMIELETGTRRVITALPGLAGYEVPLWSPDGNWILVTSNPPQLVSLEHDIVVPVNLGDSPHSTQLDWWPAKGPSCLFALVGDGLQQRIQVLDLASGSVDFQCMALVPRQEGLDAARHLLVWPRVSPDGATVLVGCRLGPPGGYQDKYGSRDRVAILDPSSGVLTCSFPAFVDDTLVEREHRHWRWTSTLPPDAAPVTVADHYLTRGQPCDPTDLSPQPGGGFVETLWLWEATP